MRGHAFYGGYYEWQGVRYVPSWGGSMFEALMPTLVARRARARAAQPRRATTRAHVDVQRRYAAEDARLSGLGHVAERARPAAIDYGEYGVRVLGIARLSRRRRSRRTPRRSRSPSRPATRSPNLRALAERYDVYGDFGFYDAVDPATGAVAHAYLSARPGDDLRRAREPPDATARAAAASPPTRSSQRALPAARATSDFFD